MKSHNCPKCQASMTVGFLVDTTHGGYGFGQWAEGTPEKSFWTGVKLRGRKKFSIQSWRCQRCGSLESYANGA